MKKYSLLIASAALVFFSACSVKVSTDNKEADKATTEEAAPTGGPKVAKVTDPVCGMTREAGENWTEFAVKGSDTTWFCSPHCKEGYEKHPEKYQAKPATEQKG